MVCSVSAAVSIKLKAAADTEQTKLDAQVSQAEHNMTMQELAAETEAKQIDAMLDRQRLETEAARAALMAQYQYTPRISG